MRGAPPDDAYGRVTNPERFAPVHAAADALVARLRSAYEVECREGGDGAFGVVRRVELVPLLGAQRTVAAVVAGRFSEAVVTDRDGTWSTFEFRFRDGGRSGKTRLEEGAPRQHAGEIIWPAWPPRLPEPPPGG
jgi:hypothetical protein